MNRFAEISCRIYEIRKRLEFDNSVVKAGNPPTLHPEDRRSLIDELDALYDEKRVLSQDSQDDTE